MDADENDSNAFSSRTPPKTISPLASRRASFPESSQLMALVSSTSTPNQGLADNHTHSHIPLLFPHLPSDYLPSPTSPKHFVLTYGHSREHRLLGADIGTGRMQSVASSLHSPLMVRQRSHSAGPSRLTPPNDSQTRQEHSLHIERSHLAIEGGSSITNTSELVPYREWTVISRNDTSGQMVLFNPETKLVTVQRYMPDSFDLPIPSGNGQSQARLLFAKSTNECPMCHRPLSDRQTSDHTSGPTFMDRNYFRLLASSTRAGMAPPKQKNPEKNPGEPLEKESQSIPNDHLKANAFNQGYYENFFVELKKLGRGFRGSVFLCNHELDGVKLGKYAVKKVAIGNNHPWLVRMLREVHLLERLRHPNIVSYKHSWLEYSRLTPFGPKVPCLFILMECANGGNLEEYLEPEVTPLASESLGGKKKTPRELKRERIRRQQGVEEMEKSPEIHKRLLSMAEVWSLFLDIVEGLAHLHQQNIVHRDLKPPNLLLKWDERSRNRGQTDFWRNKVGQHGIPRVLISDFGECEDLEGDPDNDRTGATGTLEFMAPEHVALDSQGKNRVEYSSKADMWSLGMVLYYLCYSRLPYSNVDDVDVLRNEILAFREVKFPKSRFDVYNGHEKNVDPAIVEAIRQQTISPDIPQEIKILIRLLLSTDPNKRPSCEEILSKLRKIQNSGFHIDGASILREAPQDISHTSSINSPTKTSFVMPYEDHTALRRASWESVDTKFAPKTDPTRDSSSFEKTSINRSPDQESDLNMHTTLTENEAPVKVTRDNDGDVLMEGQDYDVPVQHAKAVKRFAYPTGHGSDSRQFGIRKRRKRVNRNTEHDMEYDMYSQSSTPATMSSEEDKDVLADLSEPSHLLLGSPDIQPSPFSSLDRLRMTLAIPQRWNHTITWLQATEDQYYINVLKTITAIIKVSTCTYPCQPYSPSSAILYPVVILATLDFWSDDVSQSILLVMLHLGWVITVALLQGGMCAA
ncbi:kinase-like domain-containing protein [Phycomyces nitens]|nr:kinase-like domain-containing protein [Phycomyces nitens]